MRSYLASRRRFSEKETPEPRFHWRTRVDSLMNEDESKPSASSKKSETRPLPINPTHEDRHYKNAKNGNAERIGDTGQRREITTTRSRLRFENQPVEDGTEERKRERFVRTNSDSRLKMRVRFSNEAYLETSRSLDTADENNDIPGNQWRMRHLRRSRSRDKSGTDSLDRSEGDVSADDDVYMGACGASFDSGLDLRGSSSPEDDDDARDFMEDNIRREMKTDDKLESVEEAALSEAEGRYKASDLPAGFSYQGGAIPKRLFYHDNSNRRSQYLCDDIGTAPFSEEKISEKHFEDRGPFRKFDRSTFRETSNDAIEVEKDYFRDLSPEAQFSTKVSDHNFHKDPSPKENTPPHSRPGYGFFCDQIDGIEDIIERIISEEEQEAANSNEDRGIENQIPLINDGELRKEIMQLQKTIDECNHENADDAGMEKMEGHERSKQWKVTTANLVIYSDKRQMEDRDEQDSYEGEEDSWSCVPNILLEDIFTLLTPKDRHQASQVCRQWFDLFYSPRVWETFILLERTLTKKRFNLYKGYQRELCPWKTQLCLRRVGSFFKRIVITPITDYFNLFEFLRILAAFLQYQEEHGQNAMPLLHTFDFTFACATRGEDGVMVHGTGGQILDMIVKLLIQMSGLKHLKLNQLLTDVAEVPDLFSALTSCFNESLNSLEMLNVTKVPFGLTDLSQFRNLIKLTISPQHLDEEVLVLLAGLNLLHLHLIQDVYTCTCEPVSREAWKLIKEMAPWLRVYLEVSGIVKTQLLIQPRAPVYGVFLRTPFSKLSNDLLTELVEQYGKTLHYLVQERLPRIHGPRNFNKRCDSSLLYFVRRCPHLHTLVVSERMSTATLILLTTEGKNLSTLLVRQNALIKRYDWSSRGEWPRDFHRRLKASALDYDKCTHEICTILRHRWRPLSDKQFMRLKIVPKVNIIF